MRALAILNLALVLLSLAWSAMTVAPAYQRRHDLEALAISALLLVVACALVVCALRRAPPR